MRIISALSRRTGARQRATTSAVTIAGLTLVMLTLGVVQSDAARATPFSAIAGNWAGTGRLQLDGGRTESMSCRAYYNPRDNGASLGMAIRCASASYKIELRSNLRYDGGRVSGTWEERNFNAGGNVSGRATDGSMNLSISGSVAGSMAVNFGATRQTVSINTQGAGFNGVSISLSRG